MNRDEWFQYGLERGYIGPVVCVTHDGFPTTAEEDTDFDEGLDPCVGMARPYFDDEERALVEANHPPSVWRRG